MIQPLVSILVPVYGVENYIARCSRSLFQQTYKNIEFLFINDCTKDNSITVLQHVLNEYPERSNRVKIINHVCNKGLAGARNTAVAAANGKYILHVDSDDFLIENTAVETLVEKCEEENLDLCFFDCNKYYSNKVVPYTEKIPISKDKYLKLMLRHLCSSSIWGKMIKADLYRRFNISCVDGVNFGEDYCVMPLLLYYSEKYSHISASLYGYNLENPNSYTYRFSISNTRQNLKAIDHLLSEFQLRGANKEYLDCLQFAKLKVKGEALNQWLATGTSKVDFYEIKSINADRRHFFELPLKYRLYLIISNLFTGKFCKKLYNVVSFLK